MEDAKLRELVETELDNLQLGVQIPQLRAEENLSQTKLAANAEMSGPKISAMENEPRNLTIGTLIRVAHALDSRVEIKLVRRKGTKTGRRAKRRGGSQNPQPFRPRRGRRHRRLRHPADRRTCWVREPERRLR
jgi:transcriptional regulator with XRE-family HTH domain